MPMVEQPKSDDELRRMAAAEALGAVEPGMKLGLGTGRTADHFVRLLGAKVRTGFDVIGVPTSERTAALAKAEGIRLATLDEEPALDLTIDGADEIDSELRLIKGGGGALLREKIVAAASHWGLIIVADGSKPVDTLGDGPLPVEIEPFGWETTLEALGALGCEPRLRVDPGDPQHPFVSDGGHYTADCLFPRIPDPASLETRIKRIPGALECGLFVGLARAAVVARESGVEVIEVG
jgi:ribose 5-phosphate isomerase A